MFFPLPTRLEKAEKQKLDLARDAARVRFDTFLTWMSPLDRERYWGSVEVFYEPYYAYEEILTVFGDKPGVVSSLLASLERLTAYVTFNRVRQMQPVPESIRQEMLSLYERERQVSDNPGKRATAILAALGAQEAKTAQQILLRCVSPGLGGTVIRRTVATDDFDPEDHPILERLVDEGLLSRKLADDAQTEFVTIANEQLLEVWPTLRGWVQERQDTLRLRTVLEELAVRWDGSGRDSALVLAIASLSVTSKYLLPIVQYYANQQRIPTTINPHDGLKYVWIPPGRFEMGCAYEDAECQSEAVEITPGFWMGQTEVTEAAYERYISTRKSDKVGPVSADEFPVSNVDWLDALDYCSWVGGRLPTDAEWEYAARAGVSGNRYISGNSLDDKAISRQLLRSVASRRANRFGLYDMSGNVAEWTIGLLYRFPVQSRLWDSGCI